MGEGAADWPAKDVANGRDVDSGRFEFDPLSDELSMPDIATIYQNSPQIIR